MRLNSLGLDTRKTAPGQKEANVERQTRLNFFLVRWNKFILLYYFNCHNWYIILFALCRLKPQKGMEQSSLKAQDFQVSVLPWE